MGAWSGEPFGNDVAADWAWELEDLGCWDVIHDVLIDACAESTDLDLDSAIIALAAAEVVAHGLGRPTQDDAYTGEVSAFVVRAGAPSPDVVQRALGAVRRAGSPDSSLGQLWADCGDEHWRESVERLTEALRV